MDEYERRIQAARNVEKIKLAYGGAPADKTTDEKYTTSDAWQEVPNDGGECYPPRTNDGVSKEAEKHNANAKEAFQKMKALKEATAGLAINRTPLACLSACAGAPLLSTRCRCDARVRYRGGRAPVPAGTASSAWRRAERNI